MQLDLSHFPLVWMRRDSAAAAQADVLFAQFDALLARRQAFVILSEEGFDDDGHEHPQEERKQVSLWMKQNKAAIRAYIQGMVLVEPSAAKRLAGKAFAVMFGKFWGYPLHFATSRDDALDIAQHLLRAWLPPQLPPGDGSTAAHQ
jgi:hypothetical protein